MILRIMAVRARAPAPVTQKSGPSDFVQSLEKTSKRLRTSLSPSDPSSTKPNEPTTIHSWDGSRISYESLPVFEICGTKLCIRVAFDEKDNDVDEVDYPLGDLQFFISLESVFRLTKKKTTSKEDESYDVAIELVNGQTYIFACATREAATVLLKELSEAVTKGLRDL